MSADPPSPRASDAERDATVARLREACAAGRLSMEEFTERMSDAYASTSRGQLEALTRDLPPEATAPDPPGARPAPSWFFGIFGGDTHAGRWRVPPAITVVDVFGGTDLDLRDAVTTTPEVVITTINVFGGTSITVPAGTNVEMTGGALFGGNSCEVRGNPVEGTPRVHVRAFSLFGGTSVRGKATGRPHPWRAAPPPGLPPAP